MKCFIVFTAKKQRRKVSYYPQFFHNFSTRDKITHRYCLKSQGIKTTSQNQVGIDKIMLYFTSTMMTIDTFPTMPLREQVNAVRRYGDFIGSRQCYGFSAKLYAMPGFYAEVFYGDMLKKVDHVLIHSGYQVLAHYSGLKGMTERML